MHIILPKTTIYTFDDISIGTLFYVNSALYVKTSALYDEEGYEIGNAIKIGASDDDEETSVTSFAPFEQINLVNEVIIK